MSRSNETRYIKQHETCKCRCRLDASVCNDEQRWSIENVDVDVKNWLTKEDALKNLFGILVYVNVNVIDHVT